MYIDFSIIPQAITRHGEAVDIEVYSSPVISDWGDVESATTSITNVQAIFNTYGISQQYQIEGQFHEVRYSFFFDGTQTGLDDNNVIIRADGSRWKIQKTLNHTLNGSTSIVVQEALVSNT